MFPDKSSPVPPIVVVGGKGYSLIRMANYGINVPPGFVLSTKFFDSWFSTLHGTSEWQHFVTASADLAGVAADKLKAKAEEVLSLTSEQRGIIQSALKVSGAADGLFFAVRSSSPEEDLAGAPRTTFQLEFYIF
jgi:rifampicin phosphotransferase